jgi:hypothetical protein
MALNWSSVKPEHVRAAIDFVTHRSNQTRQRGLLLRYQGVALPAKEVLRVAYRLANGLPESAEVRFSSGDGTLNKLRALGFDVDRVTSISS